MPYCKQCQLIHGEEHRFCQRCGQLLKGSQAGGRPCARCGALTYPGQKFCTDCGLPLRAAPPAYEEEPPPRPPLFYPKNNRTHEPRSRRPRRSPRLAITLLGLILLGVGGIYLVKGGMHLWKNLTTKVVPAKTATETQPQDDMRREVEKVAEKIRSANLNKDINKWLSCYHSAYPHLGRLENTILELWKNYDVREVSYRIANVQRQGDSQATADLVWNIQLWDHRTHDFTLIRQNYKITLIKTGGEWKIRDSKEDAGGAS